MTFRLLNNNVFLDVCELTMVVTLLPAIKTITRKRKIYFKCSFVRFCAVLKV